MNSLENKGFVHASQGKRYTPWVNYSDYEIIVKYKAIMLGLLNFYSLANDLYRFNAIGYLLTYSAAHTLANKHSTSIAKVFRKFGPNLQVKADTPQGPKYISLD